MPRNTDRSFDFFLSMWAYKDIASSKLRITNHLIRLSTKLEEIKAVKRKAFEL